MSMLGEELETTPSSDLLSVLELVAAWVLVLSEVKLAKEKFMVQ